MKTTKDFIPLFKQFIKESENGKRLKKNGERITSGTIDTYKSILFNLERFVLETNFEIRVCNILKLTTRELKSEKVYWEKFYKNFISYLYKKGCFDNYVGINIKIIRVFMNYLNNDKDMFIGEFHKKFYVIKEEIEILVLTPEQLKFLIHDKEFEKKLTITQIKLKDIFVFGCATGLRFSDMFLLTNKNFENVNGDWYLKIKSKKTKTYTSIKLSSFATTIYLKHKSIDSKSFVFGSKNLSNFNRSLKRIGEIAGFTHTVDVKREKQGVAKMVLPKKNKTRFCDNMSSHMMRRTAITTLLIYGMPELLVRKISGHSSSSSSFHRYVHFAQVYIDKEISKVHEKLEMY